MNEAAVDPHRRLSVECFNRAWELIELLQRTIDETDRMLLLAMASLWHWSERPDCTERERSIGCWQVSRCAALAGHATLARSFAERSLEHARTLAPFYRGYAHEALARAAAVAGDDAERERHRADAARCAAEVGRSEDRAALEADLATLASVRPASQTSATAATTGMHRIARKDAP